jgi:large subunit ribosomal protein L27e
MPTRYALDLEALKGTVTVETFKEPTQREDAKKVVKKIFEERYTSGPFDSFLSYLLLV